MKLISILVIFLLLIFSCSSENQETQDVSDNLIDSFESAIPHGKTLKKRELSAVDKEKLADAMGVTAKVLTFDSLSLLISQDSSGLIIYNFWKLNCQSCKSNNIILKKLQYEVFDSLALKVVYVNVEDLVPDIVNSYIRENEIINEAYIVEMDVVEKWPSYFQNGWEGQLPAMLIVNHNDGIRLFYQKAFSLEELEAVLLPLTF